MITLLTYCPGKSPCDPCRPPPVPATTRTTPGGWYCVIEQIVYTTYYGGPTTLLASVNVGPTGYTSGTFNQDNPYPGKTMLYVAYERNIAYPASIGYTLGQFANPVDAMAICQSTLANSS